FVIPFFAVVSDIDRKAFFFESLFKSAGERLMVLNQQHAHGFAPFRLFGKRGPESFQLFPDHLARNDVRVPFLNSTEPESESRGAYRVPKCSRHPPALAGSIRRD